MDIVQTLVRAATSPALSDLQRRYRFALIPGMGGADARYDALPFPERYDLSCALRALTPEERHAAFAAAERALDEVEAQRAAADEAALLATIPAGLIELWSIRGMRHSAALYRYSSQHNIPVHLLRRAIDAYREVGGRQEYGDGSDHAPGSGFSEPTRPNCA